MIKANGAVLEWAGYEYARMVDGEIVEHGSIEQLQDDQPSYGGSIYFRAVYHTEWMICSRQVKS